MLSNGLSDTEANEVDNYFIDDFMNHFNLSDSDFYSEYDKWFYHHCNEAAQDGDLDKLIQLRSIGYPWDVSCPNYAATGGFLHIVQYCFENGCPGGVYTTMAAAQNGHLDILKYCVEKGCEWDYETINQAILYSHLNIVEYCLENGCPYNPAIDAERFIDSAVYSGVVETVEYLVSKGFQLNENHCGTAVLNGHLEVLKFIISKGFKVTVEMLRYGAANGHLDIVKYCHSIGVTLDDSIPYYAAKGKGNLDIIKFCLEIGIKLPLSIAANAIFQKNFEIFTYMFQLMVDGCDKEIDTEDNTIQTFFDKCSVVFGVGNQTPFIFNPLIDLDDKYWRKLLHSSLDLSKFRGLKKKVKAKRKELRKYKQKCRKALIDVLPLDVIKYCVNEYL